MKRSLQSVATPTPNQHHKLRPRRRRLSLLLNPQEYSIEQMELGESVLEIEDEKMEREIVCLNFPEEYSQKVASLLIKSGLGNGAFRILSKEIEEE